MKKFLILFLLLFTSTFTFVKAVETQIYYDFDSIDGWGYNLTSGKYEEKGYWSSTTKMLINPETTDSELLFTLTNFHHVLFWNDENQYIGYINTSGATIELATFLDYSATNTTAIPENAKMFVLQNYDYGGIEDDIVYIQPSIHDVAWEGLSYYDIFGGSLYSTGKTNIFNNGNFSNGIVGWSITDATYSISNGIITLTPNDPSNYPRAKQTGLSIPTDTTLYLSFYYEKVDEYEKLDVYFFNNILAILGLTGSCSGTYSEIIETVDPHDDFSFYLYNVADVFNNDDIIKLGNVMAFNLDTIFGGYTQPSLSEFQLMLDFYTLYVDEPVYITYDNIFSNQFFNNGNFSNGIVGWSITDATYSISNGIITLTPNDPSNYPRAKQTGLSIPTDTTLYLSFYYEKVDEYEKLDVYFFNNILAILGLTGSCSGTYSEIIETVDPHDDFSFYLYNVADVFNNDDIIKLGNVMAFDLEAIFGTIIPTIDTLEEILEPLEWPTNSYYTVDYHATHLDLIGASYFYDQIIHDYDAETGINTYLTNLNINDDISKVILGIAIMMIIAIGLGLATRNIPIVLITEIIAYLTFTILGWFPMWIVILLAIILSVMGILKIANKGGNSSD